MEIRTPRLILRDFDPADTAAVFVYHSDPRYLMHTPWETRTEDQVRAFVDMLVKWAAEEPRTKFQLAIVRDGVVIGNCGIRLSAPGGHEAEFGCELSPAAWGHGYALEASRALLEFGFRALRLHRVFSNTTAENTAAVSLAERLGMRREGCRRENVWMRGRRQSTILLGMLEHEWQPFA